MNGIISDQTTTPLQKVIEEKGFKSTLESMMVEYQKNRKPKDLCSMIQFLKKVSEDFNKRIEIILSTTKATENDIKMIKHHWDTPEDRLQ